MKRRPKPYSVSLPPVRLFVEDVEAIVQAIRDAFERPVTVTLTTEDFVLEDVNEVERLGAEQIHRLLIESDEPEITVALEPNGARITAADDTAPALGAVQKIERVLRSRVRQVERLLRIEPVHGIIGFGAFTIGLYALVAFRDSEPMEGTLLTVGAFLAGWLAWLGAHIAKKTYSTVVMHRRAELPGFWKTPRGTVLTHVLTAALAAAAGSVVTWLIPRLLGGSP